MQAAVTKKPDSLCLNTIKMYHSLVSSFNLDLLHAVIERIRVLTDCKPRGPRASFSSAFNGMDEQRGEEEGTFTLIHLNLGMTCHFSLLSLISVVWLYATARESGK